MFAIENIATFAEIPSRVQSFADASGWTTGPAPDPMVFPDARTFQRPEGGLVFTLQREPQTDGSDLLSISSAGIPNRALVNNIRVGGTVGAPEIPTPTRLFLFSGTEQGHAYISGVIEFGFNRYRVFYIGGLVIKGNYTGGEAISGNSVSDSVVPTQWPRGVEDHKLLFQGLSNLFDREDSGFVNIVHPDNPEPILPNHTTFASFGSFDTFLDLGSVLGGPFDQVNDTFVRDGQEHFAAATLLTPYNLMETTGTPIRFRPLGHIAGARMVNITNLEPGQQVTVGAVDWRVFPEWRKSTLTEIDQTTPNLVGSFKADESSDFWAVAFPENLAT